jgi:DNA-binding transcriptional ArsR family regulator
MSYLSKSQNEILGKARMRIRALNHPLRQSILSLIKGSRNKMNVTDIYGKLRIEQSVASQHLAILRRQELVTTKRAGRVIWYSVNDAAISALLKVCQQMIK